MTIGKLKEIIKRNEINISTWLALTFRFLNATNKPIKVSGLMSKKYFPENYAVIKEYDELVVV